MALDPNDRLATPTLRPIDEGAREAYEQLQAIWTRMYDNEEKREKLCRVLVNHVKNLFTELVQSEMNKEEEMKQEIEEKIKKCVEQETILGIKIFEPTTTLNSLWLQLQYLDETLAKLRVLYNEKMAEFERLRQDETQLCAVLSIPVSQVAPIPSENNLRELRQHITMLKDEKIRRIDRIRYLKSGITALIEKLEENENPYAKELLQSSEETYNLTTTYIEKMEALENELQIRVDQNVAQIERLTSDLSSLYHKIEEEPEIRQEFLARHAGFGRSTIRAYEVELERCKRVLKERIQPVSERIKKDIVELWDIMKYTDEQRDQFVPFTSSHYCEELLELLDLECRRLKTRYEQNKHIYDLAEKREALLKRMDDLETAANDKNRYKNRGGQLLREEKERNALEKSIPKVEKELKEALARYQEENGTAFLWYGEDLLQNMCTFESRNKEKKFKRPQTTSNNTHRKTDLSAISLASYTQFQEQIEAGTTTFVTPKTLKQSPIGSSRSSRRPLVPLQPLRFHSSPTLTNTPKTPKTPIRRIAQPSPFKAKLSPAKKTPLSTKALKSSAAQSKTPRRTPRRLPNTPKVFYL